MDTMNSKTMYPSEYQNSPKPIDVPKVKLDIRGILKYAKEKGVTVPELSEEEKSRFMK